MSKNEQVDSVSLFKRGPTQRESALIIVDAIPVEETRKSGGTSPWRVSSPLSPSNSRRAASGGITDSKHSPGSAVTENRVVTPTRSKDASPAKIRGSNQEVPVTKPKRDRNFLLTTMLLTSIIHGISTKPKRDRNFLLTTMLLTSIIHGISGMVLASSKLAGLSKIVSYTVTAEQLENDLRDFVGATGICFNVLITTAYCLKGFTFMLYVGLYSYNILKGLVSSSLKSKSDKNKKALRTGRVLLAAGTLFEIAAWVPPLVGVVVADSDRHLRLVLFLVHYSLFVFLAIIVTAGIPRILQLLVRRIKKNMDHNKA